MAAVNFTCPGCGQHLEVPDETAGCALSCPSCQRPLHVPDASTIQNGPTHSSQAAPIAGVCAICQSPINADEVTATCPVCRASYHADCWQENGGCAVYGCEQVPALEQRRAIEIPTSYWGQENKPCPNCGREILAAAVRCRHCGVTFASARPQDAGEFKQRAARKERLPKVRRTVVWLFVFSVVPCLAPVGAVWGTIWYPLNREDVRALPSLYTALCKIGLAASIGQTLGVVFMAVLYSVFRGS